MALAGCRLLLPHTVRNIDAFVSPSSFYFLARPLFHERRRMRRGERGHARKSARNIARVSRDGPLFILPSVTSVTQKISSLRRYFPPPPPPSSVRQLVDVFFFLDRISLFFFSVIFGRMTKRGNPRWNPKNTAERFIRCNLYPSDYHTPRGVPGGEGSIDTREYPGVLYEELKHA